MLKKILLFAFLFVFGLGYLEARAVAPITTPAPVAVGGQKVDKNRSVESLLIDSNNAPVQLTIHSSGKSGADQIVRQIVLRTLPDEHALRYRDWVDSNRRFVHQQSQDQIGYIHIPDMKANGLAEFNRGFLTEYKYPALIVDVRHNTGGNVSPLILEKLNRKRVAYTVSRWEKPEPIPLESLAGPRVALTDQFTSSDGDIFTQCFKLYNLGPTVGKRTWGGVVGMRPRDPLVDGTVTSQPEFSHWFEDAGWNVENRGCDPDFEVEITPKDFHEGRDPQLAKAIDLMKESLAAKPVLMPKFGPRPSRALPVRLGPPSQESVVQKRLNIDSQVVGSR